MRAYGVAVVVLVSLFGVDPVGAGEPRDEAVAKDLRAFKGTWRLRSKEEDGKKFSAEEIKDVIATIDGMGQVSVQRGGKVINEGTMKLDPTKAPKTIDVTFTAGERKGKSVKGLYEIDSGTFRVCIGRPGAERPTEFSAKAGSGCILIVYKREQK
jgi:uncharacterized protein (TIGR03067 family)